jgi:hypothetical protein
MINDANYDDHDDITLIIVICALLYSWLYTTQSSWITPQIAFHLWFDCDMTISHFFPSLLLLLYHYYYRVE